MDMCVIDWNICFLQISEVCIMCITIWFSSISSLNEFSQTNYLEVLTYIQELICSFGTTMLGELSHTFVNKVGDSIILKCEERVLRRESSIPFSLKHHKLKRTIN